MQMTSVKRNNALVGLNYVNMLSDKLSLDARCTIPITNTRIEYNPTGAHSRIHR